MRKGISCSVAGCDEKAVRSISASDALEALSKLDLKLDDASVRRVYLCEKHYKLFKKAVKKDRFYERWRRR